MTPWPLSAPQCRSNIEALQMTAATRSRLVFDREDHEILEVVNPILSGNKSTDLLQNLLEPSLHPRGIKEFAAPKSLRLAAAMIDLVKTLEGDAPEHRLRALRSVRDEVLHNGSPTLTRNTARVLLQIIKEMVRAHGDAHRQVALAHDFREAISGNPRSVRKELHKYHLLEMPEDWSQMAFDHHVHDANSKGRKSPTHLVMDAWIKGIRTLGVVYYRFVRRESAAELLEAAEIMGLRVRVGVEFSARLRGEPVNIIWAPRGFKGREDFVAFLEKTDVRRLMDDGRALATFESQVLLERLHQFNIAHLPAINEAFGIQVPSMDDDEFVSFVGDAQASSLHLAEFVHSKLMPHLQIKAREIQAGHKQQTGAQRRSNKELLAEMDTLVPEEIGERYLTATPESTPGAASGEARPPALHNLQLAELLGRLEQAPRGSRVVLNPSNLSADEVIESLYEGRGKVTHLEVFNVKDWAEGQTEHRDTIARIRLVLNSQDPLQARQLFLEVLDEVETGDLPDRQDRAAKLREMLADLARFQSFYRHSHLKSRLGSDSTGRSRRSRGMGLVALRSLPLRSRRRARREARLLPVRTEAQLQVTWIKRRTDRPVLDGLLTALRRVPGLRALGYQRTRQWVPEPNSTVLSERGNIASLGGAAEHASNGLVIDPDQGTADTPVATPFRYLNTPLKNALKVLAGFVPAFLTFFLTKEWWLLAYLGAPIWFAITGLRNVLQSVLGGGGLFRSPLTKWSDFVSWERVADSLLFTGFSVPLLDYLVKTVLLDRGLNITTSTSPLLLYTVIALANGIYISSHNIFRGLPAAAAFGNFFRTVISIPLAIGLNISAAELLHLAGVPADEIPPILQLWAAVISKTASDVVAGFIEGLADRGRNVALRSVDFQDKRRQIRELLSQIALLYPERDLMDLLVDPKQLVGQLQAEHEELVPQLACNALDCMFLFMRQPRGRYVFRRAIRRLPEQERLAFLQAQRVLERKRTFSELCVAGMLGKRYDKALAFYLARSDAYLKQMDRLHRGR
jgi:hypothetical protein